ncbi:MAG: M23 family metallopeptidase [Clostridia bacterium]|nr:M23 family metallopeptidase [Clostridia bacterium]
MLFTESYVLRARSAGLLHRNCVRLRLRIRRLAAIGAGSARLRGILGVFATVLSGAAWVLVLIRNLLLRWAGAMFRFVSGEVEAFSRWLRSHDDWRIARYQMAQARRTEKHHTRRGRAAPMILMLCAVILIISAYAFDLGFEVKLNGESIGYVRDRGEIAAAVDRVEERIAAYQGAPYSLDASLTYQLRYMERSEAVDVAALENRLFASVSEMEREYALRIDGETVGVSGSRTVLELLLRRILLRSCDNATQVSTAFVNDVRIEAIPAGTAEETPVAQLEALLSSNRTETQYYTVQSGDTVSAIGQRFGMAVSEIKALNPDLDEHRIHIGQQIKLAGEVPYLSVQQTVTLAYQEEIPYETEIVYDDSMYKNKSAIRVQGVNGLADVVADVTYVNGVETDRKILSYTVLKEPVNAVKAVGTKEPPRTASTGRFIKPTSARFSSPFGYRRSLGDYHTGVDYAGAVGTNIWAADGGTVIWAGQRGNYGKYIIIDHGNGYTSYYCHCSKLLVSSGDKVAQGDVIAKIGKTGRVTGPHLHFEIRVNGKAVNPLKYVSK